MAEKLLTLEYKNISSGIFIAEIDSTNYYIFAAKSTPYVNSDSIIEIPQDTNSYKLGVYNSMLFGKLISGNDVSMMINRHDWTENTIFAMYDDQDSNLSEENYYAVVNAGAEYHLFKCLDNNDNSPSIIQPDYASVSLSDEYYETSDGYIWKYMYSLDSATVSKFATNNFFPLSVNETVIENAINGAIDIIKVEDGGYNYNNYLAGNNIFNSADLRLDGDPTKYNISANSAASQVNDYYNGCYLYISSGPADEVGQYKKIIDYYVNSSAKTIVLESAFNNAISITAKYEIYPGVVIGSDGYNTSNAVARAIINSVSNSVYKIDMLNFGANYQYISANVYAFEAVGVTPATIRGIYSPPGGHGSNPSLELEASSVGISMTFSNTENGTILSNNDYRTIGVLKNPLYANVTVMVSNISSTFIIGENVEKINPILLGTGGSLTTTNTAYINYNIDLSKQFKSGDNILLSNGSYYFTSTVNTVTNSSYIVLNDKSPITSDSVSHYIPNSSYVGKLATSNSTAIIINDVLGSILTGDFLMGSNSGSWAMANNTIIANTAKGFDTFIDCYKYSVDLLSGTFIEDEMVYQSSPQTANAIFHSIENGNTIYLTENNGDFLINSTIVGSNSGAIAYINEKYEPDIVSRSGEILYIENVPAIDRVATQSENFKLIFNY